MAIIGYGTLFQLGDTDGGGGSFTTIGEVASGKPPGLTTATVDTTNHSSPNRTTQRLLTIKTVGPMSVTYNYTPTGATHNATTGLIKVWNDVATRSFRTVYTDSSIWEVIAGVTNVDVGEIDTEGKVTATAEITPVGAMSSIV